MVEVRVLIICCVWYGTIYLPIVHREHSQSEQILEEEVLDWKVFDGPLTFGNSSNDILHDIHEADALRMVDPKGSTGRTSDDISKARSVVR